MACSGQVNYYKAHRSSLAVLKINRLAHHVNLRIKYLQVTDTKKISLQITQQVLQPGYSQINHTNVFVTSIISCSLPEFIKVDSTYLGLGWWVYQGNLQSVSDRLQT